MSIKVNVSEEMKTVFNVAIVGTIDTVNYKVLEEEIEPLLKKNVQVLIFNMEDVTYVSSMGISVILRTKRIVEENGGIFIVMSLKPQVKKVFDIIRALPVHNILSDKSELNKYLSGIGKK